MLINQLWDISSLEELTKETLLKFFTQERMENDKIEFKAYVDTPGSSSTKRDRDKLKIDSIIQTICAFLNSDGGVLIWGAPEGKKSDDETAKEKVFKGNLTPVSYSLEKDQFINKVCDLISPTPLRINFWKILLDNDQYCYVFEVAKSEFSPHQYKGTYYMRLDGSTRTAPHHYVEALMKKISFPRLQANIIFGKTRQFKTYFGLPILICIHNLSKTVHDKNVRYRILSIGGGIHDLSNSKGKQNYDADSDIYSSPRDIIHYNMPTYDSFYFTSKRLMGTKELMVKISIFLWGDLSPVISSRYNLVFQYNPQSGSIDYMVNKQENEYLFENDSKSEISERDRIEKSDTLSLELLEDSLISNPFINVIRDL